VRLTILRKGETREITATLGEIKSEKTAAPADVALLESVVLGPVDVRKDLRGRKGGAVVLAVDPTSAAGRGGLKAGDIVLAVDLEPVRSPQDVIAAARQNKDQLLLQVLRDGNVLFVVIS